MINGVSARIDPNVLAGKANQRFEKLDANKDNGLSLEEAQASLSDQNVERLFASFDIDQDGIISREEHDQVISERIQRVIDNQSGNGGRSRDATSPIAPEKEQYVKKQNLFTLSNIEESVKPNIVAEISQIKGVKAYLAAAK